MNNEYFERPAISKMVRVKHNCEPVSDWICDYRGFSIERNLYGRREYVVKFFGEDITCSSLEEAKREIDEIIECMEE